MAIAALQKGQQFRFVVKGQVDGIAEVLVCHSDYRGCDLV